MQPEGFAARDGFTLIELLIVIAVLGILTAVAVIALSGVSASSAVSACQADVRTVATAVAAYDADTGGIPEATESVLLAGDDPYLAVYPSSPYYAITIDDGQVMVAAPSSASPVPASSPDACAGAASLTPGTTTTVPPTTTTSTTSTTSTTTTTTTVPPTTTTSTTSTTSTTTTTTTMPPTTTTSTTSTTTTTVPPYNDVTLTPSSYYDSGAGEEFLQLEISSPDFPITSLTVTISADKVSHVTNLSGDAGNLASDVAVNEAAPTSHNSKTYTFTFTLTANQLSAMSSGGPLEVVLADSHSAPDISTATWSATSTSDGVSAQASGQF